jgi:hypothetical protein
MGTIYTHVHLFFPNVCLDRYFAILARVELKSVILLVAFTNVAKGGAVKITFVSRTFNHHV